MNYTIRRINDIVIFHLECRFDDFNCFDIEIFIKRALQEGERKIILSLEEADFISSSGYRVLVSALSRVREEEGVLVISGLPAEMHRLFHDIKLDRIFTICRDEQEALELLANRIPIGSVRAVAKDDKTCYCRAE